MKKKMNLQNFIITAILSCVILFASWTDDPPNFHTGAPGEFSCGSCHIAAAGNMIAGEILISGIPDTIQPNTDYRLVVKVHKTAGNANKAGFQLTILNALERRVGVFSDPSANADIETQTVRDYFEHHPASTLDDEGYATWEVTWTSPSDDFAFSQDFKLYAGAVIANGDSTQSNDLPIQISKTYHFNSSYERMSYSVTKTDVLCNNGNDGTATIHVSLGRPPYKFIWSNGETSNEVTGLHAGTYSYTVTDAGIDTIINTVTINQPFAVFGEIIKTDIPCNSPIDAEAIAIPSQGVEPYTYEWSNGATTKSTSFSQHGPIYVTITDANGCTYVAKNSIIRRGNFTATITDLKNVSCNGGNNGSATVEGSIPHITSYFWSTGDFTQTVNNLPAGTYEVTLTNPEGCEARAIAEIKEPSKISVKSNLLQQPSCQGSYNGVISAFADGGVPPYQYLWEDGTANRTIQNLIKGTYSVTVTDAFGCSVSNSFTLTEPGSMSFNIDLLHENAPDADNGKANIFMTGGTSPYTFSWSDGLTGRDRSNLKPGFYSVTATDIKGCTKDTTIYIYPFECDLLIQLNQLEKVKCNGDLTGLIDLTVSGGTSPYEYAWSNGQTDDVIDQLPKGNYVLTVTDANGCVTNGYFNISEPPKLIRKLEISDVTNPDFVDGKVKYIVSGGTAPYTIILDQTDTVTTYSGIVTFENLFNDLHSSHIIDANGCRISELFVIDLLGCDLKLGTPIVQDVSCHGGANGAICITVQGATGSFSVFWDDETSELCRTDLSAGGYNVHISDSKGCQVLDTLFVKEPTPITIIGIDRTEPSEGQTNGQISVLATGGIPPYTYQWFKGNTELTETSNKLTNIAEGVYRFNILDAKGCLFESDTLILGTPELGAKPIRQIAFGVAPNPAQDRVNISFEKPYSGTIYLIDVLGHVIDRRIVYQKQSVTWDVSMLKPGMYTIQAHYKHGIGVSKIIIQ